MIIFPAKERAKEQHWQFCEKVTFLGWWVHVTPSKVVGDLQRLGMKKVTDWITWLASLQKLNLWNSCRDSLFFLVLLSMKWFHIFLEKPKGLGLIFFLEDWRKAACFFVFFGIDGREGARHSRCTLRKFRSSGRDFLLEMVSWVVEPIQTEPHIWKNAFY